MDYFDWMAVLNAPDANGLTLDLPYARLQSLGALRRSFACCITSHLFDVTAEGVERCPMETHASKIRRVENRGPS